MPASSTMPIVSQSARGFPEPSGNGCGDDRIPVCLLDDDPSTLKPLGRLLSCEGFHVEKFNHPAAFLSAIAEAACRVAVLDVWMPDMNGLEGQEALRQESPD